ncbi:MAG: helix-turn-helix transcriptional regulator [Pseudomonadota bacterium]|uniref:helix-turn-helix transcriptional regulator n=1 Tax=Sphingomonas sp. ERG5 TaxID=1381597 RepID=UPI00054BDA93|nr:helix-turn-helix transcriptional regulator [Sphingomonas sp. ERG5]
MGILVFGHDAQGPENMMPGAMMSLIEPVVAARDAARAARDFSSAATQFGVSYFQARHYRRPPGQLTAARHWAAGGLVERRCVAGWIGGTSHRYICFDVNPLVEPIARGMTRYRFSDFAPRRDRRFGDYWDAMSEGRIGDALGVTAYGYDGAVASLHIGFADPEIDSGIAEALHSAGTILAERLLREPLGPDNAAGGAALSARERDAIGFVAEGKTDWEIATIMGVAETTARFHVDNARRKLGAVNRAHAVARLMALGL